MNIGAVPYQAFPSIGYAISVSQGGRMSVPVPQSSYIYSHFKHISGVPAPEGVSGVNINKLKIIDALIEQLSRMKKQQPEPVFFGLEQDLPDSEKQMNTLINQFQNQIRTIQTANANNPYAPAAPLIGAVFNIKV
jgi:hypothetical protein